MAHASRLGQLYTKFGTNKNLKKLGLRALALFLVGNTFVCGTVMNNLVLYLLSLLHSRTINMSRTDKYLNIMTTKESHFLTTIRQAKCQFIKQEKREKVSLHAKQASRSSEVIYPGNQLRQIGFVAIYALLSGKILPTKFCLSKIFDKCQLCFCVMNSCAGALQ